MAEPVPPAVPPLGGFAMLATNDDALCVDGVCAVPAQIVGADARAADLDPDGRSD